MVGVRVRSWMGRLHSWVSHTQASQADEELCPLPPLWSNTLEQKLHQLPYPASGAATVREQIADAIAAWQENPDAPNSLVLLTSPVESSEKIFQATLQDSLPQINQVLHPIPWHHRSRDPLTIAKQLAAALDPVTEHGNDESLGKAEALDQRQTVIVLPPLEFCFLRCIGGWQGVIGLRDQVGQQRQRFWLLSCNTWAWGFLNRVCQVGAYFNQQIHAPDLDAATLKDWLTPLIQALLDQDQENGDPEVENGADSPLISKDGIWSQLAGLSLGGSQVATALWLNSLRLRQADMPESFQPLTESEALLTSLQQLTPALPSLPTLLADDHYVLHALMLHGPMTRSHLALSLGQAESLVQVRVQMLRQAGIIRLIHRHLAIHPAYYPQLCAELSHNNFLTGDAA